MASIIESISLPPPLLDEKTTDQTITISELPTSSSSSTYDSDSDSEPTQDLSTQPQPSLTDLLSPDKTHLISSPYPNPSNQLSLTSLDVPNKLFALALTALQPIRPDYATAPYLESFNWAQVFSLLRELCEREGFAWGEAEREFYVVIFRSKLAEGIDRDLLGDLDRMSHEEACASGGLLKYWFGEPDFERRNLATCLWRNHADAVAGGKGPWHAKARAAARTMYDRIDFHVHRLFVGENGESWRMEKFR